MYHVADQIAIKNDGANDCPAYGILRITGRDFSEGRTYLKCDRPDGTYRHTYIVNGPQELKAGKYGVGYFGFNSPVWAAFDAGTTPSAGDVYGPVLDSFELTNNRYGFRALGSEESDPFDRIIVIQQPPACIMATLDASLSAGSNVAASVQSFTNGATADTSMNVTAYGEFLATGESLDSSTLVELTLNGGQWIVTQSQGCPA